MINKPSATYLSPRSLTCESGAALPVLGLTCGDLADEIRRRLGKGNVRMAAPVYRRIFTTGAIPAPAWQESGEPPGIARRPAPELKLPEWRITEQQAADGVVKFGAELDDGAVVESVVIPAGNRTTLCVSSQAGCAMGCRFCETGRMGFVRQLSAEEIVWQAYAARFILKRDISNAVFMGMGEPLDNLEAVAQAIRVLSDPRGMNIPCRRITLSTAGHADGIRRLAAIRFTNLRLAISLNAASDSLRSELMPINRKFPLAALKKALLAYPLEKGGVFLIEYVLLAGVNDAKEHADQLADYLADIPSRVNLIAYNSGCCAEFSAPAEKQVCRFREWLAERKLFVRVRPSRGRGVMAACGQLAAGRGASR